MAAYPKTLCSQWLHTPKHCVANGYIPKNTVYPMATYPKTLCSKWLHTQKHCVANGYTPKNLITNTDRTGLPLLQRNEWTIETHGEVSAGGKWRVTAGGKCYTLLAPVTCQFVFLAILGKVRLHCASGGHLADFATFVLCAWYEVHRLICEVCLQSCVFLTGGPAKFCTLSCTDIWRKSLQS